MKKKKYVIFNVSTIVKRECGIKEPVTFGFLVEYVNIEISNNQIFAQLNKQIEMYNEFCPEEYKIACYFELERMEIEKVGEIWL